MLVKKHFVEILASRVRKYTLHLTVEVHKPLLVEAGKYFFFFFFFGKFELGKLQGVS